MTTKNVWRWKKHNFFQFLLENGFTEEITVKHVEEKLGSYCGYYYRQISDSLHELLLDGDLEVFYVSDGSRTIARYKISSKPLLK